MSPSLEDRQPVIEVVVEDPVVLEIPNSRLSALCLHPIKYLRYLAWTILMLQGTIQRADTAGDLPDEFPLDSLLSTVEYNFVPRSPSTCEHSSSPYAVKSTHRSSSLLVADAKTFDPTALSRRGEGSATSDSRKQAFMDTLIERDERCIFTGFPSFEAVHIIPLQRGNEVCFLVSVSL